MAFDFIQSHAQDTHHFFFFTVIIMVAADAYPVNL